MRFDTKWRFIAAAIFIFFTIMELGDWFGQTQNYAKLTTTSPGALFTDLIGMILPSLFALGIALSSALTAYGLLLKRRWVMRSATAAGIFFILYGLNQILSAVLNINPTGIVLTGVIFIVLGSICRWLVDRALIR
jgi:hypothetical protein